MSEISIQPGQRTLGRLARDLAVWLVLLSMLFGRLGNPCLRVGKWHFYGGCKIAPYLALDGSRNLEFNIYGQCPLIVFVPLKNSMAKDVWNGLVVIKRFAFD